MASLHFSFQYGSGLNFLFLFLLFLRFGLFLRGIVWLANSVMHSTKLLYLTSIFSFFNISSVRAVLLFSLYSFQSAFFSLHNCIVRLFSMVTSLLITVMEDK